jgi:transcription initiation factor TFIID subunit 2
MDLNSMSVKLEQGLYRDRFAFEADFRLMINNAKMYNVAESYVYNEAKAMEAFFEKSELEVWLTSNWLLMLSDSLGPY